MKINPKVKNIILFVGIAVVLVILYSLIISGGEEEGLVSSSNDLPQADQSATTPIQSTSGLDPARANRILSLLLSVRSITLDASVFSDIVFISLRDSTVDLDPDGTEGRPNPFAPIGNDIESDTQGNPILPDIPSSPEPETVPISLPTEEEEESTANGDTGDTEGVQSTGEAESASEGS